ncbi:MFS transporter [Pseudogemmobacter blasticus]|uniref:Multidrug MFS transporter n=1 Tax=Fuscovulum blasticum DSM 2131 TaxID=1188250 RepID=A0A2T4JAM6_FUSBL|nr:MFS transporter [Fuscovulum blasticum]PTE14966.1 multidrug MFS transporter [Fuscovulum blasticum DSM 2131]
MTRPIPAPERLSQGEFIALIAMLFATIALSIDAMLPALPEIAQTLTPDAPNRAQLVLTSFVFGMGLGTLVAGPLSDAFGRKPVILFGSALYCAAALACYFASSLELLLVARVVQGIGSAGPRTVSMALMRDLFQGREMARIMSFAMMVFTMVPALAPLMGQGVIALSDWQTIFLVYIVFAAITMVWLGLRQPETLPPPARRPLSVRALAAATRELFSHRVVLISILCQSLTLGALFSMLSSIQGIFDLRFDRADQFPLWFGVIAVLSAFGSILNAKVVVKVGMRRMVTASYAAVLALTLLHLALVATGLMPETLAFAAFVAWGVAMFGMMGLTIGNLNALAMEPVGHIAGLAASVISAIATVASVLLAIPVGQAFDGTALPLLAGVSVFIAASLLLMRRA